MNESEQVLINPEEPPIDYTQDIWRHIAMKLLPFILLLISIAAPAISGLLFLLSLPLNAADAFVTLCAGYALTGLRWSYAVGENGQRALSFHSKPDPYIPMPSNVRAFWGALLAPAAAWALLLPIVLFTCGFFQNMICICNSVFLFTNIALFNKCRSIQIQQGYDAVRTILLGEEFSSELMENDSGSSGAEESNGEEEQSSHKEDDKIELKFPEIQQEQTKEVDKE